MSAEKKDSRFLDKWKLVRAAAQDNKRLSTGDLSVLIALCDRYGSKYDMDAPALAGHALLGAMAGLSRRATIDSTRRLIDAGYISVVELGSGTRGTKYGLNFNRGEAGLTTTDKTSSSEAQFTTVVNYGAPLVPPSGEASFTESPPTVCRLQAHIHVVENKFEDAATPPPPSGLKADGAVPSSGDGFEEFWKIWPRKHGLKKARAEWDKIEVEANAIITAATAWRDHYGNNDTDMKWIPEPANWLRNERWMEDLPIIHSDAKGAAISKAKANAPVKASNDDQPETEIAASEATSMSVYRQVVIDDIKARSGGGYEVRLAFKDCEAGDAPSTTEVYSNEDALKLLAAVGVRVAKPNDELKSIGRPALLVIDKDDRHSFEPLFRSNENVEVTYEPLPARQAPTLPKRAPWRSAA